MQLIATNPSGSTYRRALLLGIAMGAFTTPVAVWAQGSASATTTDGNEVEIVVQAQRRSQRLEDVPMAITALRADDLAAAGISSVQELAVATPGLQISMGGAFASPSIRGVTSITNGNNIENNVALYIDGFYQPNALVMNQDLANIESVEVLKGPQGTLYGRNATGGAILVTTLSPSKDWTGSGEISYARFNDKRAKAYVSGPITDNIGISLAAYHRQSDGYIKLADPLVIGGTTGNAAPIQRDAIRAKLRAEFGDVTATLAYGYTFNNDPRGSLFSALQYQSATYPRPPARPVEFGVAAYNYKTTVPAHQNEGTLKLEWDSPLGKLSSYTGYARTVSRTLFDFDGTYTDQVYSANRFQQDTWQQSVDLAIDPVDRVKLIIGGMYYDDRVDNLPNGIEGFGPGMTLRTRNLNVATTKALSGYIDGTWEPTDSLSINLGGRYSWERKGVEFIGLDYQTNPAGSISFGPFADSRSFKAFTPRASIRYGLAERTNVYLSYSKGFRAGQYSLSPPLTVSLYLPAEQEKVDAYEIGIKTKGSWWRVDAAAFYYDYSNLQVNVQARPPVPFCPAEPAPCGLQASVFSNAPKAEVYGAELQLEVKPVSNLSIRAGGSLLHARFGSFPNATGTGLNAAGNGGAGTNVTGQQQDWSGQPLARAPNFSGNIGVSYRVPISDGGFDFSGNIFYTERYVVANPSTYGPLAGALANVQRYTTGPYTLINASITYTEPSGHVYVGLFGNNLGNEKYRLTYNGSAFGDYSSPADPATYGVKVGFRY